MTPVGVYINLRDEFPNTIMLESSDYHGEEHNYSYICFDAISSIRVQHGQVSILGPKGDMKSHPLPPHELASEIERYLQRFTVEELDLPFIHGGLFGYLSYEAIPGFEDIEFQDRGSEIPQCIYTLYRYVIAFNHFNNELFLIEALIDGEAGKESHDSILRQIRRPIPASYRFTADTEPESNCTDEQFLDMVHKGIHHCQRGDVFQIVVSRSFERSFKGDDLNVYRALRSVNPSPYLFYFDYGSFKLFGSSPEAQLIIKGDQVTIHPIAGTFKRSGDDSRDAELARQLVNDPKENAEHVMLVDLARNDLSRNGKDVTVDVYREVQYFSHVIHLVSKVTSTVHSDANKMKIIGDTFPAGTLSGAPKYRAMQLIDQYESTARGFYGGAIGHLAFNGDFNHAIMIRTFRSKANKLRYQAGAGVVVESDPQSELKEVDNKLMALNKAIELAQNIT